MLLTVAILLGVLGHLSSGVPLEDSSSDFSQFFSQQRIVGGSVAAQGRSPHMVGLVVGSTWKSFVCGGSIITVKCILTAAHCIQSFINWDGSLMNTVTAVVGTNTWQQGTEVELESFKMHPEYDPWLTKSDAGMLIARHKIQMSARVAPIGLHYDHVMAGEKCFVTGWGTQQLWGNVPNELQILYVDTISHDHCSQGVANASAQGGWNVPPVHDHVELCTFHSPGYGMCHGDSGSALVALSSGKQCGIVSWGIPCAVGGPDVFVRVSGMKDFIEDCIKDHHH